jgi:hypothetical protein
MTAEIAAVTVVAIAAVDAVDVGDVVAVAAVVAEDSAIKAARAVDAIFHHRNMRRRKVANATRVATKIAGRPHQSARRAHCLPSQRKMTSFCRANRWQSIAGSPRRLQRRRSQSASLRNGSLISNKRHHGPRLA